MAMNLEAGLISILDKNKETENDRYQNSVVL